MAMDFPASPTDGQTYSPPGGPDYIYRTASGAWEIQTSGSNSAFVAKAGDVMSGDLTIEKSNARLYLNAAVGTNGLIIGQRGTSPRWAIYAPDSGAESGANVGSDFLIQRYNDAGVVIDAPLHISRATGRLSLAKDPTAGLHAATKQYVDQAPSRNRIVNGAMQISQQWDTTVGGPVSVLNYFMADQWGAVSSSTGTASAGRVLLRTPNGSQARVRINVATISATPGAGEHLGFSHPIEGIDVYDFLYGLASARQAILRFGFKGPPGTYSIALTNNDFNYSYVANFTILAGQSNTDTEQVFVIPGPTAGVWLISNVIGILLRINMMVGTTYQGVAGWQTGFKLGTAANTNGFGTAGNTFELFDVGFYLDAGNTGVAPRWQAPDWQIEFYKCQRYYRLKPPEGAGIASDSVNAFFSINHHGMRVAPTASGLNPIRISDIFSANFDQTTPHATVAGASNAHWGDYLLSNFVGLTAGRSYIVRPGIVGGLIQLSARM